MRSATRWWSSSAATASPTRPSDLVRLGLGSAEQVRGAAGDLLAAAPDDGEVHLLVAPMLRATRELIAGLHDDSQFGMTVMLGVGGILAEAVADVSFRLVPITRVDAEEMIDDLALQALLGPSGANRPSTGPPWPTCCSDCPARPSSVPTSSADLNPLLVVDGRPVAVDALVEVRS